MVNGAWRSLCKGLVFALLCAELHFRNASTPWEWPQTDTFACPCTSLDHKWNGSMLTPGLCSCKEIYHVNKHKTITPSAFREQWPASNLKTLKAHVTLETWKHVRGSLCPGSLKAVGSWKNGQSLFWHCFLKRVNRLWSFLCCDLSVFINIQGYRCQSLRYVHIICVYKCLNLKAQNPIETCRKHFDIIGGCSGIQGRGDILTIRD